MTDMDEVNATRVPSVAYALHRRSAVPPSLRPVRSLVLALVLGVAVRGPRLGAQARPALGAAPIERVREDVLQHRYADAIRRGNEVLGSARAMTLEQRVVLWQMMAAAYYPPNADAQRPDSALLQLDALVRVAPDATLPPDVSWAGLDTLLEKARAWVFAVVARPQVENVMRGTSEPAYITVVATRPTRFRLTTVSRATGVEVVHDTIGPQTQAQLRLRAHDGRGPLWETGEYELRVTAYDAASLDSAIITHDATASASALSAATKMSAFVPPAMTTVSMARRGTMIATGLAFAGVTFAIASQARASGPIRSTFRTDQRAMVVGSAMLGAAIAGLFLDRGKQRPSRAADIVRARAEYEARVAAAADAYRARIAKYRVVLQIEPESR